MKELLKKTAALWIAVFLVLAAVCLPVGLRARAASGGSAYLTVELLPFSGLQKNDRLQPLGEGFLCTPSKIEIVSGETAAQTLMRFLAARGYAAYYTGTAAKNYQLGYIADGDKTAAYQGYTSSVKDYPVKAAKKIEMTGELPPLAQAMLGTYGVKWDEEKDKINIKGYLGAKDLAAEAGWIFSLNNTYLSKSLSDVKLSDGDTLRVEFSLAGGRDLGYNFMKDGSVRNAATDRTKLIKLVADYENNHKDSALYDASLAALGSLTLSSEDVTRLSGGLVNELKELKLYSESTTAKPASSAATTKPASTTTTKPASASTTGASSASTTKSSTSTTKASSTSTTKASSASTTKASSASTTKASSTSTTKASSASTTKASSSSSTTAKSGSNSSSVTAKAYSPMTTSAGSNDPLTTLIGQTTLPGETTTIERPTGIVLEYMRKEVPATEETTTAPDETEDETTENAGSFADKLKSLRYSNGALRNTIIVCAVVVLVAVVAVVIRKKTKKPL